MNRFLSQLLLFLLSCNLAWPLYSAEPTLPAGPPATAPEEKPKDSGHPGFWREYKTPLTTALSKDSEGSTNVFEPLKPAPDDGKIAYTAATMLEHNQFLRQHFNATVSSKFLDKYLETYDPEHLRFLQTDIAGFEHYRTNLQRLTLDRRHPDTSPACEIFNRFMERLEQQVAYVDYLLDHEKFTFDTDERVTINRKDLPYPKNLDEARKLWRDRLRAEYLQEKLVESSAEKKAARGLPKEAATNGVSKLSTFEIAITNGDLLELHATNEVSKLSTFERANVPSNYSKEANAGQAAAQASAKPKTGHEGIVEMLHRRYHRSLRALAELNDEDILGIYLTTLARVYDPHSDYLTHSQLENFAIAMNLRLEGIGAELRSEDGYCTVNKLLPGPAMKSKQIKENDRIVAVAQSNSPPVDLVDMRLTKAVQLIRGPKGTQVTLTIQPAGSDAAARRCVTLIRDEITLRDEEAKAKVIELPDAHGGNLRLGVIDLISFYAPMDLVGPHDRSSAPSTTADVRKLLDKLKKENVKGLILDLRHNGGGSLEEAIRLTGLFIKEGPVVQVRNWDGSVEKDMDPDSGIAYDGPLIVLTDRFSASASEILAGALQDYARGLIVGDSSTHGKGTVQSLVPLNLWYTNLTRAPALGTDPGAMKITIKKFYRPSGASTQRIGVVPDIILPSVLGESKEIGESTLENALEADAVPSADFERLNRVGPYLAELRKHSAQRLAADPEFAYIRQDIENYKKLEADKSVSLNEKQRLKQKEEDDAREQSRKKERLARKPSPEIVHELTLLDADKPGLPPPAEKTNLVAKALLKKEVSSSAGQTNASVGGQPPAAGPLDDLGNDLEGEKPPAVDAALVEAEHILVDYLSVLPKTSLFTSGGITVER